MAKRGDGKLYRQPNSQFWFCCYYVKGERFRQSTGEVDEKKAQRFLDNQIKAKHADEIGARKFVTPQTQKQTIGDLLSKLQAKYEQHIPRQDSPQNLSVIKRATADFGDLRAAGLDADVFDRYKARRLAEGDALASIQRVLQMVRSAYNHARKHDRFPAHEIPFIEIVKENNVRRDCYSEGEFQQIYKHLRPYLKDFALFAIRTAMRFSEISSLRWEDIRGDVIELRGENAKGDGSGENARFVPMVGKDLAGILERRTKARQVKGKKGAPPILAEYIFHHGGQQIVDIRKNWRSAIKKSGLRHLVFHTLRHSAVRAFDDAGLSRDVAMSLSGHRTQAMYSRYNFSDEARKRSALEKAQQFAEAIAAKQDSGQNVIAMQR